VAPPVPPPVPPLAPPVATVPPVPTSSPTSLLQPEFPAKPINPANETTAIVTPILLIIMMGSPQRDVAATRRELLPGAGRGDVLPLAPPGCCQDLAREESSRSLAPGSLGRRKSPQKEKVAPERDLVLSDDSFDVR